MRPVDASRFKYRDNLASKRRQRVRIWTGLITLAVVAFLIGLGYVLFYAPWFKVNSVTFEGLNEQHQTEIQQVVNQVLDRKTLGLAVGRDIFFVHASALETTLLNQFSFLEHISVQKKYFHGLKIVGVERQAEGVWCFTPPAGKCKYFDHSGITWGQAIQSSGSLLLNIDDMRIASGSESVVDRRFLKAIQLIVPALSNQDIKTKNVIIPVGSFTEFDVVVSDSAGTSYPIKFSLDSDLAGQLKTYQIFRSQKMANGDFHPQYIDLRFDGRVYFK